MLKIFSCCVVLDNFNQISITLKSVLYPYCINVARRRGYRQELLFI